jgi:radical SAM superfamily enzyme YgiQ (UPF0313 family)
MNRKVLVILESSTKSIYFGNYVPLGPLYVVSSLRSNGINADFLDRNIHPNKEIDFRKYDIVGFSTNVNNIENTLASARIAKKINPHVEIVIGGTFSNLFPEELLKEPYINSVISGEGEESFYEYVSGVDRAKIRGLYYKKNGDVHFAGMRDYIENLDAIPFPALDKIDISKYNILVAKKIPISNIITSRGCPHRCIFCHTHLGKKWRARTPKNVVDEIEWQVKVVGAKEINIFDDNFSHDIDRAKEIFDKIVERKIKVSLQLPNGLRVDRVDRELIEKMHAAGVWLLCLAPETGSHDTFRRINKGFKLEDTEKIIKWSKEIGVSIALSFVVGFPWERESDFLKTAEFAYRLNPDFIDITKATAFPGTVLYQMYESDKQHNDVFKDKAYFLTDGNTSDPAIRSAISCYKKFYINPKKLFRIIFKLELYSPIRLFKLLRTPNVFSILRKRFGLVNKE